VEVAGVGEVGGGRAVIVSEELGDLSDAVGAVVEEEEGIAVCRESSVPTNPFIKGQYISVYLEKIEIYRHTHLGPDVHAPPR
jgi:hypothetical protein